MTNESLIFVSYHNIDMPFAFQLADLLNRYYRNVWLDRYEVEPSADWKDSIHDARARATGAIAVVTDDYLQSAYCQSEFAFFQDRGISVTAVIARDFSTEEISNFSFSDWVDFRRWFDDPNDLSIENLVSHFPQSESVPQTSERRDYLRQFIQDMEIAFSKMPTAWAAMHIQVAPIVGDVRPRAVQTGLLQEWDFTVERAGNVMPLSDLQHWVETEAQYVVAGDVGSGKTFFARLLSLAQAHIALRDESAVLPIWLDMAGWDASVRSVDEFFEANWPLLSYWRHWMETEPTTLILDNWSDFYAAHPGQATEFVNWIDANPNQRVALLASNRASVPSALPMVSVKGLNTALAQKYASGVLTLEQQNSFRQLLRQRGTLICDSPLAYLSVGLELLSADRALAFSQWQKNAVPALVGLREKHAPASRFGLRAGEFLTGLEELAWSMMQQDKHRFVSFDAARATVRDVRVIEYAQSIGLLTETGSLLRFESELLQWHLAAESLKRDGLVKHLARPVFEAEAGRVAQKWDQLTILIVDSLSEENRLRVVSKIADIDPFLAGMCLRRHPVEFDSLRETLIHKMIDLCAQNSAARGAFRAAIAGLAEPDITAEALIGQMSRLNNKQQLWLWHEIGSLPLALPIDYVDWVAAIDHSGDIAASEQLSHYSLSRSIAYLVKLSQQDDAKLRRNAIWILGERKYLPTAILLLDNLNSAEPEDIETVLDALMKFAYSEILARVLRWSQDNMEHRATVLSALAARKRWVTSRLLALADARRLTFKPHFFELAVNSSERDIAIGLAQIAGEYVDLPENIELAVRATGDAAALGQQIRGGIKHLPNREAFQQLVDEIARVLDDPPEATVIAGSKIDALLYGEPVFDNISAQAESSALGGQLSELSRQLRHGDWRQRHQAISQLTNHSPEESLPLLLDATADSDKRVRLAAYEVLALYETEVAAQKALTAAISDPDIEVVMAVTRQLKGKDLADFEVFFELLDSANPATVAAAIEILGASRQQDAIEDLSRLAQDTRQPPQGGATIGQRARTAIDELEASVLQSGDSRQNGAGGADGEVNRFTDEEKVRRTLQVLRDDDWGRTQKAAKFLRKFARHIRGRASGEVSQLLCDALSDPNWSVRWAAAEALAVLHDRTSIPALSARLQDSSWIVQVAAIRALVELQATEAAVAVSQLLQSRQTQVREAAAEALGAFNDSRAVQPLGHVLAQDPDDFVRLAAMKSICFIGPANERRWLELALSDSYVHIRLFAMQRLGPRMDESDLPILQKLLEEDEPSLESLSLRDLAIQTLEQIDSPKCRQILESLGVAERGNSP